jgi:hypothetical protein
VAKAHELDHLVEVAAGEVGGQVLAAGLVDEVRMDVVPHYERSEGLRLRLRIAVPGRAADADPPQHLTCGKFNSRSLVFGFRRILADPQESRRPRPPVQRSKVT